MPMPNEDMSREIFNQLNLVVAGVRSLEALAAVQDLLSAMICVVSENKAEARGLVERMLVDVQATINKNFDWYHSQKGQHPAAPASRS